MHACYYLSNTLSHCSELKGVCTFQSMCSLSNLVARCDFFCRTAGRTNMKLIVN